MQCIVLLQRVPASCHMWHWHNAGMSPRHAVQGTGTKNSQNHRIIQHLSASSYTRHTQLYTSIVRIIRIIRIWLWCGSYIPFWSSACVYRHKWLTSGSDFRIQWLLNIKDFALSLISAQFFAILFNFMQFLQYCSFIVMSYLLAIYQ